MIPAYEGYAFAQIPQTLRRLLLGESGGLPLDATGSGPYDLVVHLCIDGFGWRFFERYVDAYPFLKQFVLSGKASKISSQFPSTTVAHMTCLHFGLPVGQSGLYEWFYYEPLVDRIITPLRFSYAGDRLRETLLQSGVAPKNFFPFKTFYEGLKEKSVESFGVQNKAYAYSPFSELAFTGAAIVPVKDAKDTIEHVSTLCRTAKKGKRRYIFAYLDDFDASAHEFGPDSEKTDLLIRGLLQQLEALSDALKQCQLSWAFVVSADHGQITIDPAKTYYLNEKNKEILPWIQRNRAGNLLAPAGSARDFFLHIQKEHLAEAHAHLSDKLSHIATVEGVENLIDKGYFGAHVSQRLKERIGNLVILPKPGECVWWLEKGHFENHFYGMHGGLTPGEMETIFLFLEG